MGELIDVGKDGERGVFGAVDDLRLALGENKSDWDVNEVLGWYWIGSIVVLRAGALDSLTICRRSGFFGSD